MEYVYAVVGYLDANPVVRFTLLVGFTYTLFRLLAARKHLKARAARKLPYTPAERARHEEIAELRRKYDDQAFELGKARGEMDDLSLRLRDTNQQLLATQKWLEETQAKLASEEPTERIEPDLVAEVSFQEADEAIRRAWRAIERMLAEHHYPTWDCDLQNEFIDALLPAAERQYERQCSREGQKEFKRRQGKTLTILCTDGEEHEVPAGDHPDGRRKHWDSCPVCESTLVRGNDVHLECKDCGAQFTKQNGRRLLVDMPKVDMDKIPNPNVTKDLEKLDKFYTALTGKKTGAPWMTRM